MRQARAGILRMIAEGKTLRTIAAEFGGSAATLLLKVLADTPAREAEYRRALENSAHALVDEALDITRESPASNHAGDVDTGDIAARKLRADVLRWVAAKRKPKDFGDKQTLEHTGDSGGPVVMQIVTGVPQTASVTSVESTALPAPGGTNDDEADAAQPAERPVSTENDGARPVAHDLEAP